MQLRKPYVAGSFYPSEPSELLSFFKEHLSPGGQTVRAVVLPHAGYVYSGRTACRTLSQTAVPEEVLLIGPDHRGAGSGFSAYPQGAWETPLGRSEISEIATLVLESSREVRAEPEAHFMEHSLEVLIPMLQYKNPGTRIAPLLIGTLDARHAGAVAAGIGQALAARAGKFLTVISNDMSHYEPDAATREKDKHAVEAILKLDAGGLLRAVQLHGITMCGIMPVFMLLMMKDALGIKKARLVEYTTSAAASGDYDRVVGYAGFIFE
jgi:MEMO1 family protein